MTDDGRRRISLDPLRARSSRREHLTDQPEEAQYAAPVGVVAAPDPAEQAVLADTVGTALFVVLCRLRAAERIAFVLHDLFGVSFDEIAPVVGATPTAARRAGGGRGRQQFAGRARVARTALVDGAVGAVWSVGGTPRVVFDFLVRGGRVSAITLLADTDTLDGMDLEVLARN